MRDEDLLEALGLELPRVEKPLVPSAAQEPGLFAQLDTPQGRDLIQTHLKLHFRTKNVRADGNCQFRAIAWWRYGSEEEHRRVRREVYDQLVNDPHILRLGGSGENWFEVDDGVYGPPERCLDDGLFGNHATLQAAANRYHARIVYVDNTGVPQAVDPCDGTPPGEVWYLRWLDHTHYMVFERVGDAY